MLYDPSCPDYLVINETDLDLEFCLHDQNSKKDFGRIITL